MTDYDSPWKEALAVYFQDFMTFFFPQAAAEIDWSRGYEVLEQELRQVIREAEVGPRRVDVLVKVWLQDGQEEWILIHVEVQSQYETDFPERMFVYNYRLFDSYHQMAVSLAILGDDRRRWKPRSFGYKRWGCSLSFRFPVVKLLDYADKVTQLEQDLNPFAMVVLAHLKTQETHRDPAQRRAWKFRLIRGLYERGFSQQQVRHLFRIIDWMMNLPVDDDQLFWQDVQQYEREKKMRYIPPEERMRIYDACDRFVEAIEVAMEVRFGAEGLELMPALRKLYNLDALRAIHRAAITAKSVDEVRRLIPSESPQE